MESHNDTRLLCCCLTRLIVRRSAAVQRYTDCFPRFCGRQGVWRGGGGWVGWGWGGGGLLSLRILLKFRCISSVSPWAVIREKKPGHSPLVVNWPHFCKEKLDTRKRKKFGAVNLCRITTFAACTSMTPKAHSKHHVMEGGPCPCNHIWRVGVRKCWFACSPRACLGFLLAVSFHTPKTCLRGQFVTVTLVLS